MLCCPCCGSEDFSILWDDGYTIDGLCSRCDREFTAQRDYPYIEEPMEIKTISYKRTHNLSNYNSESLEMQAELDYDEDPMEATQKLKDTVLIALGLLKPPAEPTQEEKTKPTEPNETTSPEDNDSPDLDDTPF